MSTSKHFDRICCIITICAILLTILFMNGESLGIELVTDADSEAHSDSEYFTENDQLADWDTTSATLITLNGDSISIQGKDAYVLEGDVILSNSGKYVITGSLNDGSVIVDANENSKVWILFDGVDISCSDDACFRVNEADKVFLTLADGSENILTGGDTLSDEALEDKTYGVIFAHDDLSINGNGSLEIEANYKHGIKANDDLVITGGSITISAPGDGIHVNDSVRIREAALTINAEDDGIHSDGFFYMESGTVLINTCYEGIEAITITVDGGDITIYPSDDGMNANGGSSDMFGFGGGQAGNGQFGGQAFKQSDEESAAPEVQQDEEASADSGNEEETFILINGGNITIINDTGRDADGLDSNGSIYINGGNIRISLANSGSNCAIDFGSESGGVCKITGGTVIACGSSGMAESFDNSSTQCSILYNSAAGFETGSTLTVEDEFGNILLSWEVPCSFSSANLSSPELETGHTYSIIVGEEEETITINETSASYGDAESSMFGGTMNWGGMQKRMGGGRGGRMAQAENSSEGQDGAVSPADMAPQDGEDMTPPDGMTPRKDLAMMDGMSQQGAGTFPNDMTLPEDMSEMRAGFSPVSGNQEQTISTTILDYSKNVYLLMAVCSVILVFALIFAKSYSRRR